jgi:hypothetical protein
MQTKNRKERLEKLQGSLKKLMEVKEAKLKHAAPNSRLVCLPY